MKNFLKITTIVFLVGIIFFSLLHEDENSALALGAYPPPNRSSTPGAYPAPGIPGLQPPTVVPAHVPVAVSVALDVKIDGLEKGDLVEVDLIPDIAQTAKDVTSLQSKLEPIKELSNGNQRINWTNIPAGSYKLVVSAPSQYFREPQGYLFRISASQEIERTSDLPFHFKLIPPSQQQIPPCRDYSADSTQHQNIPPNEISAKECLAEKIIDLSGPHKAPMITSQNAPAGYYYDHVHDTSTNAGVWARMLVVDPKVPPGPDAHHVVEHVYATDLGTPQQWIEAGWAEVNWRDNRQYIFQFDSVFQLWNFYDQYSIAPGDTVTALVQHWSGTSWKAQIYRNNTFIVLASVNLGLESEPHAFNGLEVYSGTGVLSIVPASHFDQAYLYRSGWIPWDSV